MIRVLIADDSRTTQEFLAQVLHDDPEVTVVGRANDGIEAVAQTKRLRPDVIVMDVNMPNMNGLDAARLIMFEVPTPIVVASSIATAVQASASFAALEAGALVLIAKPAGIGSPQFAQSVRDFVNNVKAMAGVKVVRRRWPKTEDAPALAEAVTAPARKIRAVAMGASTGGPAALGRILSALPADYQAPVLVVQHMAAEFIAGLASWLAAMCRLEVRIAVGGEPLVPATVYLAGGSRHMGVSRAGCILLDDGAPISGFRPSVTYLFERVAEAYGSAAAAVILTGMGEDGVAGLQAIRNVGGHVIAQDETTCTVFGMPGAAIAAGLVNAVLPLPAIAGHLTRVVDPEPPTGTREPLPCSAY